MGKIDVKKHGFESQKASTNTAPLTEVTSPESVFFTKFAFVVFFTCFPRFLQIYTDGALACFLSADRRGVPVGLGGEMALLILNFSGGSLSFNLSRPVCACRR